MLEFNKIGDGVKFYVKNVSISDTKKNMELYDNYFKGDNVEELLSEGSVDIPFYPITECAGRQQHPQCPPAWL